MAKVIILDETDNVATAIVDIGAGETIGAGAPAVVAAETIPFGFKLALTPIAHGETVLKYGQSIGLANGDIGVGACVHVHNVDSQRGRGDRGGR